MKKGIKILSMIVGILIILVISGFFLLVHFVNPNQFKPMLESTILENTGRTLAIDGDLHWSFFPWLNIQIDQMTLSNPTNFSLKKPFLSVKEAHIRLKVLPLLFGQVAFNKLVLQNAVLNLAVMPSGENNWQLTKRSTATTVSTTAATSTAEKRKTARSLEDTWQRFSFHAIQIQNGTIYWQNEQINREVIFSGVTLNAKNVQLQQKFPIKLSLTVHPYDLLYQFALKMKSTCYIDFTKQEYKLDNFILQGAASSVKKNQPKRVSFNLAGNLNLNLNKGLLNIQRFSGKVAGTEFNASVTGEKITQSPLLKGKVKISSKNLRGFFQNISMPLRLPNKASLQKFLAVFNFQFSPKFLRLTNLKMTIDQTDLSGEIDFTKFGKNALQINLNSTALNIDNYLPLSIENKILTRKAQSTVKGSSHKTVTPKSSRASIKQTNLFPAWLKNLTASGQINIQQLRYQKLLFDKLKIDLSDQKVGQINAVTRANFYGGNVSSQLVLVTSQPVLSLQDQTQLKNVSLKELLQDLTGQLVASGQLQLTGKTYTRGNTTASWLHNLNGSGTLNVNNGQIYGIDMPQLLQKGLNFLKKHVDIIPNVNESTPFSTISATYRIRQGVLYNNDLLLQSPKLMLKGNGQLNFVSQQINYYVNISQSGKITIPLILSGPLFNPRIRIDIAKLLQHTVQTQLTKPLDELKESPQKAGQWIKRTLSGLS
jgi:AsmA protein